MGQLNLTLVQLKDPLNTLVVLVNNQSTLENLSGDSCNCWFHLQCTETSEQMFDCYTQNVNLEWLCLKCGVPDINSTIFDSSISSEESSSEISTKIKAKMLRIMIVNFQGIWSEKEFFEIAS